MHVKNGYMRIVTHGHPRANHQGSVKRAVLVAEEVLVFSPLSHSHPISKHCTVDPCDHDFWLRQDLWILAICDEFHILCLDGWLESKGIDTEYQRAQDMRLPTVYHEI